MGKTKIKSIDDSAEVKKEPKKLGRQVFDSEGGALRAQTRRDELVEKLKKEFGIEEKLDVGSEKIDKEVRSLKLEETSKDQTSKIQHQTSRKVRSKKYQEVIKDLDRSKTYPLNEAIELAQKTSYTKFPGTLEVHINTTAKNIKGCEPNGQVIHLAVGKVNQSTDEITANIKSLYQTIGKSKISKITLSATMGPGVKVDLSTI